MSLSRFLESNLTGLAVGSIAAAVSLYILYGPSQHRSKRRDIRGLTNTGNSCFVNAVLQALAACPTLYFWLQSNVRRKDDISLRGSMCKVLGILNNLESDLHPDPYSPTLVLHALRAHGWIINREEQDAHEMLNIIMTTLEEEAKSKKKSNKPSHASLLDISNLGVSDDDEEDSEMSPPTSPATPSRGKRGVSLPPTSPTIEKIPHLMYRDAVSRDTSPVAETKGFASRCHRRSSSGVFNKFGELIPNTLDSLNSAKSDLSPFTGMLTSKLSKTSGESSSPVRYSSFNNITLNLPAHVFGYVSLETLLQMFISQENVEGETKEKSLIKQLTFGKLPECLCLHIQRTGFAGGQPFKRHEFVEFPAILTMDKYIYSKQLIKQKSINNLLSQRGSGRDLAGGGCTGGLYSLRAVIVHSGGIDSGHYITYRKGAFGSKSEKKWFYTSDSLVKQVSFEEVSRSCAYMLFYEKE